LLCFLDNEYIHEKKCDIIGALELAMRSYIPMYLFERIVRNHNIEYENTDLVYLKSFSTRSLQGIAYELSMMEATLLKEGYLTPYIPKPIGSIIVNENFKNKTKSISDEEFNIPFLFKVANKDKLGIPESKNQQIYILSIFKAIAFFIELSKVYRMYQDEEDEEKSINKREVILKDLIEKYRVNLPTITNAVDMKEEYYKNELKGEKSSPFKKGQDILEIDFTDSSFGVLEIATFSKRLVDFFMNVRDNIPENRLLFNQTQSSKEDVAFHSPIITYFTSFTQSLFLSLFNSIKKDGILSIKSNNEKDKIIYRKNSLYGTDENNKIPKLKQDHLYQENICNLKNIVNANDSNDSNNKIQRR